MSNQILRTLPGEEHANIVAYSTRVTLAQNFVICRPGQPIEHVYFLESGLVSLLATGRDGRAVETALVGPEGLVGSSVVLGPPQANGGAVVRLAGDALRAPIAPFLESCERSPALRSLVNRHLGLVLSQAEQNAFCHALHSIEQRFCRWVLQVSDNSGSNVLEITQELCAQALGVQRTSVSMIAHSLQLAGSIRTRRGKIEILDRSSLQNAACECYEELKQRHAAYLKAA